MTCVTSNTAGLSDRLLNMTALVLVGVVLGWALGESGLFPTSIGQHGGSEIAIPGEDWHGNVRRSD